VRVLLVHPHKYEKTIFKGVGELYHPLGLLYIASTLRERGHMVRLHDEYVDSGFGRTMQEFRPDVVGIGVTSPLMDRAALLTRIAKGAGAKVIIGGPHVTALPAESLEAAEADAAVVGEGELVLPDLLDKNWDGIQGLAYRKDHQVIQTGRAPHIEDLDSLPFPARDLCDPRKYRGTGEFGFPIPIGERWLSIIGSRGCPHRCSFCASPVVHGHAVRQRSVSNIVAEMVECRERWGTRNFSFLDDTFTLDEQRVCELSEALRRTGVKFRWACFTRVGVSRRTLIAMKKGGCVLVSYGVEGGAEIRRQVGKGITREAIVETFRITREVGLRSKAYFMVGLPGETEADYEEGLRLAKEIEPDYLWVAMFYPLAGTPLYEELRAEDRGLHTANPGSFFLTTNRDLMRKHRRFLRQFYVSPRYAHSVLRRASLGEWLYIGKAARAFLMMRLFAAPVRSEERGV